MANSKKREIIQDTIEKALKKILKSKIRVPGAGRTDKGVHVIGQYANFKFKKIKDKKFNQQIFF